MVHSACFDVTYVKHLLCNLSVEANHASRRQRIWSFCKNESRWMRSWMPEYGRSPIGLVPCNVQRIGPHLRTPNILDFSLDYENSSNHQSCAWNTKESWALIKWLQVCYDKLVVISYRPVLALEDPPGLMPQWSEGLQAPRCVAA